MVDLAVRDLRSNGRPDIVAANQDGSDFSILLNAGDGTFARPVTYSSRGGGGGYLATGDFNRDGTIDIALSGSNSNSFGQVAIWLIVMRLVDLFWMTRPEFTRTAMPSLWDLAAPLALIGLWIFVFAGQLKRMPLLPLGDPKLEEAIEQHEY